MNGYNAMQLSDGSSNITQSTQNSSNLDLQFDIYICTFLSALLI